jgi:hypothetical protein
MSANPRIGLGGRPPPSMDLNASYVLWAITTAAILLAGLSLIANLWIYAFNGIGVVYGWPVMYPDMNHDRWLFASGLFGALGGAGFLLKSRVDARCRSITTVRLAERLIARAVGADPVLDKFQCRARVEIDVYSDDVARAIKSDPSSVIESLESGLEIAISDQITRYSKAKIEETLKLSLGERFDLLDIAGITLLDLRQERVVDPPEEASQLSEPGEEVSKEDSDTTRPVEPPAESTIEIDTAPAPPEPAIAINEPRRSRSHA